MADNFEKIRRLGVLGCVRLNIIRFVSAMGCLCVIAGVCAAGLVIGPDNSQPYTKTSWSFDTKEPFEFAVLSDSSDDPEIFRQTLRQIAAAGNIKFVIHLGDIADYRRFPQVISEIRSQLGGIPLAAVIGNHDRREISPDYQVQTADFRRYFGPTNFHFSAGNILFVAIDNSTDTIEHADIENLKQTLAEKRGKFARCVLLMHEPPRDPRIFNSHAMQKASAGQIIELCGQFDIDTIFAGHLHAQLTDRIDGVTVHISGPSGQKIRSPDYCYSYLHCKAVPGGDIIVSKAECSRLEGWKYYYYRYRAHLVVAAVLVGIVAVHVLRKIIPRFFRRLRRLDL